MNWELFTPRNLFVIAAMSLIAYMAFNYFSKAGIPAVEA